MIKSENGKTHVQMHLICRSLLHSDVRTCFCDVTQRTCIVDDASTVDVCMLDHLIHFLIVQLLPNIHHDVSQLWRRYEPVSLPVERYNTQSAHVT